MALTTSNLKCANQGTRTQENKKVGLQHREDATEGTKMEMDSKTLPTIKRSGRGEKGDPPVDQRGGGDAAYGKGHNQK